MTDVFISYSKSDQAIARTLASDLKALGFGVWWDFELYAGEDFHDAILPRSTRRQQSSSGQKPQFARRGFAMRLGGEQNKLITTHVPGFNLDNLPLGFGHRHSSDVEDRTSILRALGNLGLAPPQPEPRPVTNVETTSVSAEKPSRFRRIPPIPLKELGEHPDHGGTVVVLKGRYGPYLKHGHVYATIPRGTNLDELTIEAAVALLSAREKRGPARPRGRLLRRTAT